MRKSKTTLALLVAFSVMGIGLMAYAQPKLSADIPADVRWEIERLYSSNPVERGQAAYNLRKMGKQATPAAPHLIEPLSKQYDTALKLAPDAGYTTAGNEAAKTLIMIGKPAVEPLIRALRNDLPQARQKAAVVLGEIGDRRAIEPLVMALANEEGDSYVGGSVRETQISVARALEKITGKDFGEDYAKWQKWWEQNKGAFLKAK